MRNLWIAPFAAAAMFAAGCAHKAEEAKMPTYTATLAAASGVTSAGKGSGVFTLDPANRALNYTVTYEGLTGAAMAAHIHGPADAGANAGVVVPFANAASPITGTATLTEAQVAELNAGKYYVNVHTAANKGGEIRGQIVLKK